MVFGIIPECRSAFFGTGVQLRRNPQLKNYIGLHVRAPAHGHRGKGGNPLNEVHVLCSSILLNQGKLQFDKLPVGQS